MNRNLLDRKSEYPELVTLTDLLDKTIAFGTQIFEWDVKTNQSMEDIVCQAFFKNILEIGDGISILVQKASVHNAQILLRSLVENLFYLEYLLESDSKNRALAYMVGTFHRQIKFYSEMDQSTDMGKFFRKTLGNDRVFKNIPFKEPKGDPKTAREAYQQFLRYPDFVDIEKEFQNTLKKGKSNPPWFSLWNGPYKIEQLAKHLNLHALYEILYRGFSESVHSSNAIKHSLTDLEHGPGLGPMRNPENADMIVSLTLICLEMVYANFVEKRIPSKATAYGEWHQGFSKDFEKLFN